MRFGHVPERQDAIDHRLQLAALDEAEDVEEVGLRAHGRAEHLDLTEEDLPEIDAHGVTGQRTSALQLGVSRAWIAAGGG